MSQAVVPSRRADLLRLIEFRLAVDSIEQEARTPGVSEVYRVIVHCDDSTMPDRVATLTIGQLGGGSALLRIHYARSVSRPLILTPPLPLSRARAFVAGLRTIGFDRLDDAPDLPWRGVDLWLVERAAGTFRRDVVLAPAAAKGPHAQLAACVKAHLPEITRPVHL